MRNRIFLLTLLSLLPITSLAETRYVTDLLHLNLFEQPQSKGKSLKTVKSGEALIIIEQIPGYSKVKTRDNITGWTKSAYLVTDKPARLIVADMERKMSILQKKSSEAVQKMNLAVTHAEKYQQMLQTNEQNSSQHKAQLIKLEEQNNHFKNNIKQYESSVPLKIFISAIILFFIVGLLLGWFIIDYRIRKRHGGFRLY